MLVTTLALAAATGGVAAAQSPPSARAAAAEGAPATCVIHSLPSFVAQGEGPVSATVGDIVEVECNPTLYGTKSKVKLTAKQLFSRCEGGLTWLLPNQPAEGELKEGFRTATGPGVTIQLDPDGNGTVALLAGPNCAAGESLITAHMEEQPFETFATSFTVLPPQTTPPGVFALPGSQVEDSFSSAVATIVQAEFAEGSEKQLSISSEELFARCRLAPHLRWARFVPGVNGVAISTGSGVNGVQLDNDGNAFVIAIGDSSCAAGSSLIEADLESKPFTTFTTTFDIQPPQPTAEPAFTIEKLQAIRGGGAGFTSSPLVGLLGQSVDYRVIVKNTAPIAETLSELSDPHCDAGTLAGGPPAGALAAGESTTFTCSHVLGAVGPYVNEATITANTVGGRPLTHTSNQVLVEVPSAPGFAIEKRQRLAGSGGAFTASQISGALGQTVEYQITVRNTGNQPLKLSGFADPRCDSGTIAGGPGEVPLAIGASTTYTCSHALTSLGAYVNEATVTANPPAGSPLTHTSNPVEAIASQGPAKEAKPLTSSGGPSTSPQVHVLNNPPQCGLPQPVLRNASGPKRGPFALQVSSLGVKRLTAYLDGHKLKTLSRSQAKGGKFTIAVDPRSLSYGPHKVLIKAIMTSPYCASIARSAVFVRTKPFVIKFTG